MYEELKIELTAGRQIDILDKVYGLTSEKIREGYFLRSVLITPLWFSESQQRKKQPNSYKATVIYGRSV